MFPIASIPQWPAINNHYNGQVALETQLQSQATEQQGRQANIQSMDIFNMY